VGSADSTGRQRCAKSVSPTKPHANAKVSKRKVSPGKNKVDRSYKPRKGEEEELQEVKLNKWKKKAPEDAKLYRPSLDDEEGPLQVNLNKRNLKVSQDSRPYKPERAGVRATRKQRL
jgi:hypothetical protein